MRSVCFLGLDVPWHGARSLFLYNERLLTVKRLTAGTSLMRDKGKGVPAVTTDG